MVNETLQTAETQTYTVTEDIVITYEEKATPYTLTINEQDKLDITLNGQLLDDISQIELHLDDELTITAKETLENYNQLIIVEGATKQGDGSYKVTGNVVVTYLEVDKQLYFTYKSNNDCYEVKASNRYISGKIVIPAIYTDGTNGVHKVEIPMSAFMEATKITELVISEGIEKIGTRAFSYCSGMVSVSLPEGLTTIGESAFAYCEALTSITLPESLATIDNKAFDYCKKLIEVINKSQHIQLEKGSDTFGGVAQYAHVLEADESKKGDFTKVENGIKYYENTKVQEHVLVALGLEKTTDSRKELTFESSTTAIGYAAFKNNQKITTLILPNGLKYIDDNAFDSCTKLYKITWPATGSLKRIGKVAFNSCFYTLTDLTLELPEGLESIGDGAFSDMVCLDNEVKIILPTTLKTVGKGVFSIVKATDGPAAQHQQGKIVSVTVQSNIEFPNNEKVFGDGGIKEVIVRNAEIYKNITDTLNSQGNLFYDMQAGSTIKVLKEIVDDSANNPMPDYLSQSFTESEDAVDGYYTFTKNET